MGQQSLIYTFVARGTVILAEYTEFSGNFNTIAAQCLQKLPASSNRFTYNCDGHTFNYLVDNGFSKNFFIPFGYDLGSESSFLLIGLLPKIIINWNEPILRIDFINDLMI
ncbi:hypothetical protein ERO13_A09G052400v2 [Gossypium hirsutum]|uniref:Longin domain-containing protein n=4 Tax=Gossypium TaxID=3633 RepID=A0A5J5UC50_GOSBA|nr:hypothetical protein ES319_A09G056400v1 [Gossypium barbadense]KAG4182575.1 hypothetical protein ERO13_A09G052400v2 [Gossypium hirsutum]TYH01590.1 hypothetical protein ES288_A09G071300v1 [Gossypium darwinii]TYI09349.1 hypothetical protein ES332_A09G066400v1 [Gossypium tomentosum]TYJ17530.1 hypothetical protein E1A91_A09G058500v1 [Gossypium mustelinum]